MLLSFVILLLSCEKNIDFDLKQSENKVVVDAVIENEEAPVVVLTKSFNFFSSLSKALLDSAFIHDAEVYVSNGSLTHKLKEYKIPLDAGYSYCYYSVDPSEPATMFLGTPATSYSLKIKYDGKEYNSTTTIPALVKKPDSLWWKPAPFVDDSSLVVLWMRVTDPPGLGNCVRYFTKRNSERFLPGDNSVFEDQVIDGSTLDLDVPPGIDRNDPPKADSNYFKKGDTVTIKFCNIDKPSYKFWSTWEFAQSSIGNPFSQPNKVIGNISNGALGAFYGYGAIYKTIIIPK